MKTHALLSHLYYKWMKSRCLDFFLDIWTISANLEKIIKPVLIPFDQQYIMFFDQ